MKIKLACTHRPHDLYSGFMKSIQTLASHWSFLETECSNWLFCIRTRARSTRLPMGWYDGEHPHTNTQDWHVKNNFQKTEWQQNKACATFGRALKRRKEHNKTAFTPKASAVGWCDRRGGGEEPLRTRGKASSRTWKMSSSLRLEHSVLSEVRCSALGQRNSFVSPDMKSR